MSDTRRLQDLRCQLRAALESLPGTDDSDLVQAVRELRDGMTRSLRERLHTVIRTWVRTAVPSDGDLIAAVVRMDMSYDDLQTALCEISNLGAGEASKIADEALDKEAQS